MKLDTLIEGHEKNCRMQRTITLSKEFYRVNSPFYYFFYRPQRELILTSSWIVFTELCPFETFLMENVSAL